MSVLDLKSFSDTVLLEILAQLAKLKVRYHFMNYKRLAIFGPASLVINLHLALIPIDIHLPIGPKQGAFTIHMTRSEPQDAQSTNDGNHFRVKYGKIGSFQYTPAQILWNDIHSSICDEDQLVQSPLGKLLSQKFGAVNFSIRWCQVDLSQQKCLCFDIDIKHEDALPVLLNCDPCQVAIQHQCPSAEAFRAEIPLTEIETRRDHWNKVVAQQMIPKEGRVSHISFEQDKKQSARRYYDLRTTVIDSMHDYTNIITIASQPPACFFSPKELTLSFKECLREINYCDNSFIQESFTMNPNTVELELHHHDFIKHRDYHKWLFYHIVLGPEQCFHLKSIHFERDEWKVRYYDELIIRTFDQASIFITLPPGISVSQVIDKTDFCHLRNAFTCTEPSQQTPNVSTAHAGMKDQYASTTPPKNFMNGNGLPDTNSTQPRGQQPFSSHSKRPAYCPPSRPRQTKSAPHVSPESDIEMAPAQEIDTGNPKQDEKHHHPAAGVQSEDVHMECKATAIDSDANSPHETTRASQQTTGNVHDQNTSPVNVNLDKDTSFQHTIPPLKQDARDNHLRGTNAVTIGQLQPTVETLENHNDVTNVGHPRLVNAHQADSPNPSAIAANAGSPRLDKVVSEKNPAKPPIPTSTMSNTTDSPTPANTTTNVPLPTELVPEDHHCGHLAQSSPPEKKYRQPGRSNNTPKASTHQASGTIKEFLTRNTAYRQIDNGSNQLTADDDVLFIGATVNPSHHSVDNILCKSEQSRNLLNVCKEIIAGWPNSFAHADSDYFSKLATCYLIQFPSYMCYAVSALRVLTHAPWNDNMFHGHIRELVLCAIGNGWTWKDQTATVQGRRVSTGEVCAAIASYMNPKAFPPGQVSDLDTAIIAVCDDLFPDHCEFFFAHFKVNCLSCGTSGQVSVPLYDTMLSVNLEDDTVDLAQMIACRSPRLALDRDDVGFSHAPNCADYDQLCYDEIAGCLLFTLKITSPIGQLPPATNTLNFLGQSFGVFSIGNNPVSQVFVVTGIIIIQGESSHHFLIIERCHKDQVLLYDNLQGHKWIPIKQLSVTSVVWGFIFRQQDHRSYSFQPKQYKAIAPDTLTVNRQAHGPKQSKAKQKNTLGINARRYNFPKLPKKISGNDTTPTHPVEEPQQKQADVPTELLTSNEIVHHNGTPSHTFLAHSCKHDQHGVPMVGTPLCCPQHCPPAQNEAVDDNQNNQHGVPVFGSVTATTHRCAHTQQEHSYDKIADGQRGVPMVNHQANNQHDGTSHPPRDDATCKTHPHPHSHTVDNSVPTDTSPNAQCATQEPIQDEHTPLHPDGNDKEIHSRPAAFSEPTTTKNPLTKTADTPPESNRDCLRPPLEDSDKVLNCPAGRDKDASPPKRIKYSEVHPYAIISLFDGVGSAIPAITQAFGCAPHIVIAAECDPILRQIVGEQFLFRTDGKWTQSSKDTYTIYVDDVRQLLKDRCRIFREAFAIAGPQCRWFVIAGSPCQDLTPAGPLKGLLGLTGPCSSLFYYVHVILWLLQMNYPIELIRFLLENAGTMLEIHRKAILRALGLDADLHPNHFRVDPKHTHGIKRNRFYFRNYDDCAQVPKTVVLPGNDLEGPLLDCGGLPIPFGPLLRVRAVLGHDVYQLSWTAYQPLSLIWDYLFWGDKKQLQTKAKMQYSDAIPALDFAKSLPPHYLRAWNRFVRSLKQKDVSTLERDRLVRAILPIFHHPFIKAPMRILSCEEVEKLAGLHKHFDRVHAHRSLLTELTIRNYCGNSFHPEHIQAAIGHPERLRNWLAEPVDPPAKPSWTGVIHPKQARTQYHALREQVQTLARTQHVRDLASKQVGIDPMPDFPIHAIEGNLSPVMPTILPVQLLPAARKFHPDELGIRENNPPSQLSLAAIQLIQEKKCKTSLLGCVFLVQALCDRKTSFPSF